MVRLYCQWVTLEEVNSSYVSKMISWSCFICQSKLLYENELLWKKLTAAMFIKWVMRAALSAKRRYCILSEMKLGTLWTGIADKCVTMEEVNSTYICRLSSAWWSFHIVMITVVWLNYFKQCQHKIKVMILMKEEQILLYICVNCTCLFLSIVEQVDCCNSVRYNDTPCSSTIWSQVENPSSMEPVAQ